MEETQICLPGGEGLGVFIDEDEVIGHSEVWGTGSARSMKKVHVVL